MRTVPTARSGVAASATRAARVPRCAAAWRSWHLDRGRSGQGTDARSHRPPVEWPRSILDESPRLGWRPSGSVALRRPVASAEPISGAHSCTSPIPLDLARRRGDPTVRTFGMLSTFPPTACGIATFAAALSAGLVAHGAAVDVVRCGTTSGLEDPLVLQHLGDGSPARVAACIEVLNATDVVIVQHEYGIYDGIDGESVLEPDGRHRCADRADRPHRRERTDPDTSDRCSSRRARWPTSSSS